MKNVAAATERCAEQIQMLHDCWMMKKNEDFVNERTTAILSCDVQTVKQYEWIFLCLTKMMKAQASEVYFYSQRERVDKSYDLHRKRIVCDNQQTKMFKFSLLA